MFIILVDIMIKIYNYRMKQFFKKYKTAIIRSLIIVVVFITITLIAYLILRWAGLTTEEDFRRLRGQLGDSVYFWIIIGLLQIVQVIFIPVSNQIITVPIAIVFNDQLWKVWLTSWLSIWLATIWLYWIGRAGGGKLLEWLISDKEQTAKIVNWLKRGWIFYPLGMLLPLPDDLVTILSGTAKMNFIYIFICSLLTRGIDTATSTFGYGLLSRYWWGWIVMVLAWLLFSLFTFLFWKFYQKRVKKREAMTSKATPQEDTL